MAKLTLNLTFDERAALVRMSVRERRELRDQAALIIRRALESAGLIGDAAEPTPAEPTPAQPEAAR